MDYTRTKTFILEKLKKELPKQLTYHSIFHVLDVLKSAEAIANAEKVSEEDFVLIQTAALFHDSGFTVKAKNHEEMSCHIAQETLPEFGYSSEQIGKIAGMIMATKIPQTPENLMEQIIADADLDYLGRDDFYTIGNTLFEELKSFGVIETESQWNQLQIKFLQTHRFHTKTAIETRAWKKAEHLQALLKLTNT
jgi:uncharacterized protein